MTGNKFDPRIDAYIADAPEYARPILEHLRALVHKACPEATETLKWRTPTFEYKGILCGMAAFKAYCSFVFWRGSLMADPAGILEDTGDTAMGSLGRIARLEDLPRDRVLLAYIKEAVRVADAGLKPEPKRRTQPRTEAEMPEYLAGALAENPRARKAFDAFSPSKRREYIEWLDGAKTEATRAKRLATALEWIAEGKGRNWKYER